MNDKKILQLVDNEEIEHAIKFLLDSDLKELSEYTTKQRFTEYENKDNHIDYISQKEHAISWFFNKALWNKVGNQKKIELRKLISQIQCTPLIVYLLHVTGVINEEEIKKCINTIQTSTEKKQSELKSVRFAERTILTDKIGDDWAQKIVDVLIG